MSHQASRYAKNLVTAPNGEKITASEKLVLTQLADDHRMEVGVAWPSVGSLAKRCCLSKRQVRRNLASLERKQVIRRIAYRRDHDGSQSSNEYVFPALSHLPLARNQLETRQKLQKVRRSPMAGRPSQWRLAVTAINASRPRTASSGSRGHQRPPIEHLRELLEKTRSKKLVEQIPPTPLGDARTAESTQHPLANQLEPWFRDLNLVRTAWKDALRAFEGALPAQKPSHLRERPGCTSNVDAWQAFVSANFVVESIDQCKAGNLILKLKGRKPDVSHESFEPFREMITIRLEKFYGRKIGLVWPGHKEVTEMVDPVASSASTAGMGE